MVIDLSDKEQAVLDAACVRIEKATQEAQAIQRAAEQAARKAETLGHEARGIFRSIMELRGENPDAAQVNWDGTKASIIQFELPPQTEPAPPALSVVPDPEPDQPKAEDGSA